MQQFSKFKNAFCIALYSKQLQLNNNLKSVIHDERRGGLQKEVIRIVVTILFKSSTNWDEHTAYWLYSELFELLDNNGI